VGPTRADRLRPAARHGSALTRARAAPWVALALLVSTLADAQREPGWDLRVADRVEVTAGQAAPLTIAIAVDRGLTVSKDAAVIVDLAPDAGLTVKKKRLGRGDAVDPDADAPRFAINLRGDTPGDHVVRLHVRFWLCGTRSCRPIDVRRIVTVAVAAATPSTNTGFDAAPGAAPEPGRDGRYRAP
jgi:hypothetical protein